VHLRGQRILARKVGKSLELLPKLLPNSLVSKSPLLPVSEYYSSKSIIPMPSEMPMSELSKVEVFKPLAFKVEYLSG